MDQAGVDLTNDDANLFLSHQVFAYEESGAAQEAMAAGHEGLGCGSGTSTEADGTTTEFELAEVEVPEGLAEEVSPSPAPSRPAARPWTPPSSPSARARPSRR